MPPHGGLSKVYQEALSAALTVPASLLLMLGVKFYEIFGTPHPLPLLPHLWWSHGPSVTGVETDVNFYGLRT
jgi:hypothetical protein